MTTISNSYKHIKNSFRLAYKRAARQIDKNPVASFLGVLTVFVALIIAGNMVRKPPAPVKPKIEPKKVAIFQIGTAPKLTLQAQIEKSGNIQVVAQTSGIVSGIYAVEGNSVAKGSWLVSLASNYQGGNAMYITRQLAEKQNQLVEESYPVQIDLIAKQRELARKGNDNFVNLRDITGQAQSDTQGIINLNSDIISSLDASINSLSADPATATTSASLILATKELKSQFSSANLQLNTSLRNIRYQADSDKTPTELANLQKDTALAQLDLQEKALNLNREMSKLQLQLARVNEAMMYPAAPVNAVVQKIFVRLGQYVSGGTPLVSLSGTGGQTAKAVVYTSKDIADKLSRLEPSQLMIGGTAYAVTPSYISADAVQGTLYAVVYALPEGLYAQVTDKSYISVSVPLGYANSSAAVPYIPLDAIYQTQDEAYAFVIEHGKAVARKLELGDVYGRYVRVTNGISGGDSVILDRTVVEEETVLPL